MALSITTTYPMPGATLSGIFSVCGTYDTKGIVPITEDRNLQLRTAARLQVTVTKGSTTYGPFSAAPCSPANGKWESTVTLPPGEGYTVTASIIDGADMASHSIETVDVSSDPMIIFGVVCCPIGVDAEAVKTAKEAAPLPPGARKAPRTLKGKYKPADATELFGVPFNVRVDSTTTSLPHGGTHYHVTYSGGSPALGKFGEPLDIPNKRWTLQDIEVDYMQYVMFFLKRGSKIIAQTSSQIF